MADRNSARSKESRPKIELPRTKLDTALDLVTLAGLAASVALPAIYWSRLPERIPHHFGLDGVPDRWGGKGILVVGPIISLFVTGILTTVMRFPSTLNYPTAITEENALRQYRLGRNLILFIRAEIAWIGAGIVWEEIRAAERGFSTFGTTVLLGLVAMVLGTLATYIVIARNEKQVDGP